MGTVRRQFAMSYYTIKTSLLAVLISFSTQTLATSSSQCSCELQAFQTSAGAVCSDLSSKGYNTRPIDNVMYAVDKYMPKVEEEAVAAGLPKGSVTEMIDAGSQDGLTLSFLGDQLDQNYKTFGAIFEVAEVKSLWNAIFNATEEIHSIIDSSIRNGVEYMNPEFTQIFESMGWMGKVKTTASADDIKNALEKMHAALKKLMVDYLSGEGVRDFQLSIFAHIKPIVQAIDELMNSPEVLRVGMKLGQDNGMMGRSGALYPKFQSYSELLPQQLELFFSAEYRKETPLSLFKDCIVGRDCIVYNEAEMKRAEKLGRELEQATEITELYGQMYERKLETLRDFVPFTGKTYVSDI